MIADDADGPLLATLVITGRPPIDMTGPVTIGRDPRADRGAVVAVDGDPLVSKSHLAVDLGEDGLVITDLGSSNGTFLHHGGGDIAVPTDSWVPVPAGAEVEFGDQRMTLQLPTVPDPVVADDAATPLHGIVVPVPPVAPSDPWAAAPGDQAGIACAHCARQLSPGSRFCDGCGTPTAPGAAPPVVGSVPAPPAADLDAGATVVVPAAVPPPPVGPPPGGVPPSGPPTSFEAGQPGAPAFVDLSAEPASGRSPWKVILAVVGAVVVLGVAAVVVTSVVGGDGEAGSDPGSVLAPEAVDELWSESVRGQVSGTFADDAAVYVTTVDFSVDRIDVVAFDRQSGDERWETEFDADGRIGDVRGVAQGVLVLTVCDADCAVVGIDAATGDELWTEDVGDRFPRVTDRSVIAVDRDSVEIFDLLTGDRVERVRGDDVSVTGDHILVSDGDDIEVFDLDLDSVLGPERVDRADAVAFDGSHLIVVEGDELRFVDADGTVVKTSEVDVGLIDVVRPITDDNIVLGSDEGVISIDPIDGTADERWSARGEFSRSAEVDGGPVVLVDDDETIQVIDADSGERRFEQDLDPDDSFTTLASNLFVVFEYDGFEDPVDVSAYDWETGDEVWDERFDDIPVVVGGLVIEVTRDGDVVAYG